VDNSFRIGSLFGIELRVHVFAVYMYVGLIALSAMSPDGSALTTAVFVAMLFGLVLLHELGHARVAQHFGVQVVDIVLWPLGGMARMTELPEDSKIEGWIAVAGPLVNLALAGVAALGLLITKGVQLIHPLEGRLDGLRSVLALFLVVNLLIGLFNLVPAFPMDGGRLLRAWLARRQPWLAATEQAVFVSRWVAMVMIVGSFFVRPFNCMLPLIGLYVLFEGTRELWGTRLRHAARGAGSPFGPEGQAGGIDLQALFRMARRQQGGRTDGPPEPDGDDAPHPTVIERPRTGDSGFSEEDIRRMEGFQGRLRRPSQDDEA
jgi:Zn-dependent protease